MIALASLVVALTGSSLQAATYSGTVKLQNGRPGKLAVVWLEGQAKSKPLTKVAIDQKDRTFIPHITVVTKGTTVEFLNSDSFYHNVFANFQAAKFDVGHFPRGKSGKWTFDKVGLVALLCDIHAEMNAFIMVVDTPYFALADDKGDFRIQNVPPGNYKLNVWHESNQKLEQSIRFSTGQGPVTLVVSKKDR